MTAVALTPDQAIAYGRRVYRQAMNSEWPARAVGVLVYDLLDALDTYSAIASGLIHPAAEFPEVTDHPEAKHEALRLAAEDVAGWTAELIRIPGRAGPGRRGESSMSDSSVTTDIGELKAAFQSALADVALAGLVDAARGALARARNLEAAWLPAAREDLTHAANDLAGSLARHDAIVAEGEHGLGTWHDACVSTARQVIRSADELIAVVRHHGGAGPAEYISSGEGGDGDAA
jgi:hypothetical protein